MMLIIKDQRLESTVREMAVYSVHCREMHLMSTCTHTNMKVLFGIIALSRILLIRMFFG